MQKKIIHMTSAHPRDDIRIFNKECRSLEVGGYDVHLVVADGLGNAVVDKVFIHDVGCLTGRLNRMFRTTQKVLSLAICLDGDVYHLHDPELIPAGLKLKKLGKKVIFDAHEDVPKQILHKPYLNKPLLWAISRVFGAIESWACRRFDAVIAATPFICDKFSSINSRTININNFPLLGELDAQVPWKDKAAEVCYVGGISNARGIKEVVSAMKLVQKGVRLNLCGIFSESLVERDCKLMAGWGKVNEMGHVQRTVTREVLGRSVAGLVTFHPLPNHIDAQPNKMFEYMSAGIPVIASDFPLWREIVVGNCCGLCVNPMDPVAIAKAIDHLVQHPEDARQMGENGRRAVWQRYNWSIEETKLLSFYKDILKG